MTFRASDEEDSDEEGKGKKFSKSHGTCGHTTDESKMLETSIKRKN